MPVTATAQVQSLVASNTAFALDLYGELETSQGNLFFSPYSISECMAMVYAGAAGSTEEQISDVFGFGTNQQQFASDFGQLQADLEADQETNVVQLNIANGLWAQEGFTVLPSYLETVTNQYEASASNVDFSDPGGVADGINDWVSQKTQGLIPNFLSPSSITPGTVMILANAIYFLGNWTESFAASNTTTQPFYLSSNSYAEVPLMHQLPPTNNGTGLWFSYLQSSNFQALALPYGSNQLSMLILLPSQIDGLPQLEQQLSPSFFSGVLSQMTYQIVEVYLPRFSANSSFDLSGTLSEMGMPDAFAAGLANFSGIDGAYDLYISLVLHKAVVTVNESGTTAAAVTGVGFGTRVIVTYPPAPIFRADHPFIYLILDNQTGSILFMGRLASPGPTVTLGPPLNIASTGNNLKISWPYPSTGWSLLQNSDLTTTNWTSISSVSNDGTNNSVTITPSAGNMFFRLSQ